LPKRIGIVTSATGAAVRDILKVLSRRYPNRQILVLPAAVQGEKAPAEIQKAIKLALKWNEARPESPIEVLIIGRGGGSLEDLFCFNDEGLARTIFECPIPTISAVGHEIDFTIADFVADLRAPTPSAAAEIVVPRKEDLIHRIEQPTLRLHTNMRRKLQAIRLHLSHLSQRLVDPRQKIQKLKEKLLQIVSRLNATMTHRCKLTRGKTEGLIQLLNSLSPLQILGRGYSLTFSSDEKIIRSVKELSSGQVIKTKLTDGIVHSTVIPSKD
jgi:exodeoxyribonuclease VII large subunit